MSVRHPEGYILGLRTGGERTVDVTGHKAGVQCLGSQMKVGILGPIPHLPVTGLYIQTIRWVTLEHPPMEVGILPRFHGAWACE